MNTYLNVWATMQNVCKRFKDQYPQFNFGNIIDFDTVQGQTLPPGNLLGIYQLDYTERDSLIYVQCVFPVSMENDDSTVDLNTVMGELAAFVRVQTAHNFYDYQTGNIIGLMRPRDELSISPLIHDKNSGRQLKFLSQGFLFDRSATLSP